MTGSGVDILVVTADDFGLATEVNEAVERAHRDGILSAASLMVAGPAAADAVRRAHEMPLLRVGLHLTLVDGSPALAPSLIPDLVTREGRLRSDMVGLAVALATRRSVRRQLAAEIEAQMAAFLATDLPLDHVNAHKHFHLHPIVADTVIEVGARFGFSGLRIPSEPLTTLRRVERGLRVDRQLSLQPWLRLLRRKIRRAGLFATEDVYGLRWSGAMTRERLAGLIAHLPARSVEIYTHPATTDTFPGAAPGYRYTDELAALCDPFVRECLRKRGHRLGGYAELISGEPFVAVARRTVPA